MGLLAQNRELILLSTGIYGNHVGKCVAGASPSASSSWLDRTSSGRRQASPWRNSCTIWLFYCCVSCFDAIPFDSATFYWSSHSMVPNALGVCTFCSSGQGLQRSKGKRPEVDPGLSCTGPPQEPRERRSEKAINLLYSVLIFYIFLLFYSDGTKIPLFIYLMTQWHRTSRLTDWK